MFSVGVYRFLMLPDVTIDTASKTGVYCEAPLIEAGKQSKKRFLRRIIKNIQPISVGV